MTENVTGNVAFVPALHELFFLDPGRPYLNHGAFGALAKPVQGASQKWRMHIEEHPSRFMRLELPDLLRGTADRLGAYVGAAGENIVFVDNATTAINAVLRSLVLIPGDEVITTSHTYGAVMRTLEFVCDRANARLTIAPLPLPAHSPDDVLDAVTSRFTPRTRLAVLDHITSKTALVLPIEELVRECRDRGIKTLIDGAHAPGMVPLDIEALGCDFYAANCHKWLGAPRGAAFLWTSPEHQSGLRPTTISHGIGDGYIPAFDWPGTKDFAPWLTIPDALDFRDSLGGDGAIWDHCHSLACSAADRLASAVSGARGGPDDMTGFMAAIRVPSRGSGKVQAKALALRTELLNEHGIEVDVQPFDDAVWIRISAYVYNTEQDFERLERALL